MARCRTLGTDQDRRRAVEYAGILFMRIFLSYASKEIHGIRSVL